MFEQDFERARLNKKIIISKIRNDFPIETPGYSLPTLTRVVLSDISRRLGISYERLKYLRINKFYVIQFKGPLFQKWRDELSKLRIVPMQYFPTFTYLVELNEKQRLHLSEHPMINKMREFQFEDKGFYVSAETLNRIKAINTGFFPSRIKKDGNKTKFTVWKLRTFYFLLHTKSDFKRVRRWFLDNDIKIDSESISLDGRSFSIRIDIYSQLYILLRAVNLGEIQTIEEEFALTLLSSKVSAVLSIQNSELEKDITFVPYTGQDEIVGIADAAIDSLHSDFKGKIAGLDYRAGKKANQDKDNHGTWHACSRDSFRKYLWNSTRCTAVFPILEK